MLAFLVLLQCIRFCVAVPANTKELITVGSQFRFLRSRFLALELFFRALGCKCLPWPSTFKAAALYGLIQSSLQTAQVAHWRSSRTPMLSFPLFGLRATLPSAPPQCESQTLFCEATNTLENKHVPHGAAVVGFAIPVIWFQWRPESMPRHVFFQV